MKAGPLRAAVFLLGHVRAVAVLVGARGRLVGVIFTDLLVLLLFFDADGKRKRKGKEKIESSFNKRNNTLGLKLMVRDPQGLSPGRF